MYLSFYNLSKKPFTIGSDPQFLWQGENHKEAFAILKYGLLDLNGYVVLTGEVGTGKTTLLNALIETLDDSVYIASINHPTLEPLDFFKIIAKAYDPSAEISNKAEFLLFLNTFLKKAHADGKVVLLIIDEAHCLSKELLEEIRLFSNIEQAGKKLINIFFVGQEEFNEIIQLPEYRALRQRITLFYDLKPLNENETQEYVAHRLTIAGATGQLFTPKAIHKIYRFTKGYPRLINILCDRALFTGYGREQRKIDTAIIKECSGELKSIHLSKKPASFNKIDQHRLMLIGLTGFLTLSLIAVGISMNFRSSSIGHDVSDKADTVLGDQHEILPVHENLETPSQQSGSIKHPVAKKNVEGTMEKESKAPDQETATVVIGAVEEKQSLSIPAQPGELLEKASTKQPQPTTFDLATVAVEQGNFLLGIDLLESQGKNNVSNNSATSELYAKALVGRAKQVGISPGTEAKSLLQRAVDVNPNNSDAHFNLGKLYTQSKDYALAVVSYQNATRLDPELTDAFFNLGYIYATTGNYIDAEKIFIRVVQLAPKYQDKALVNLALIQDKLGKREDCLANLHKAVIYNSANVKAQNYLKKLLVRTETIQ